MNGDSKVIKEEIKDNSKINSINLLKLSQKDNLLFAKSVSPELKKSPIMKATSNKQIEKVIFPQSKGLNMIPLKNIINGSKDIDKSKFASISPKMKDLKTNQTSRLNKIIPQSTKNVENKIVLDPSKFSQKLSSKIIPNFSKSPPKNEGTSTPNRLK